MTTLQVRRLNARYHLTSSQRDERARLDRVLQTMLGDPLERALERAGVSPSEEICIRRLHVPVRLRLSSPDSTIALAWSLALSDLIVQARDRQGTGNVVRYSSIVQVLLDVAIGVSTDRFERAWAWRTSGVWRASDAPSPSEAIAELVAALLERPHAVVPVLAAAAEPGGPRRVFPALWRRVSESQWIALARAALVAAGGPEALIEDAVTPGVAEGTFEAHRLWRTSRLARAVGAAPGAVLASASIELRRAFALLILLECDPGALRGAARSRMLVSTLSDALHPAAGRFRSDRTIVAPARPANAPVVLDEDDGPPSVTRRGFTAHGGLVFLLNVFDELALPATVEQRRGPRTFRWVLHQLAIVLCGLEPGDPAALAFAGLPPTAVPPSREETPPTQEEQQMLTALAEQLTTVLAERIEEKPALSFVCERPAEVVADPGWLVVRFAFAAAATSVRRAGLDLNPAFVPWLGTVVMFSYE